MELRQDCQHFQAKMEVFNKFRGEYGDWKKLKPLAPILIPTKQESGKNYSTSGEHITKSSSKPLSEMWAVSFHWGYTPGQK